MVRTSFGPSAPSTRRRWVFLWLHWPWDDICYVKYSISRLVWKVIRLADCFGLALRLSVDTTNRFCGCLPRQVVRFSLLWTWLVLGWDGWLDYRPCLFLISVNLFGLLDSHTLPSRLYIFFLNWALLRLFLCCARGLPDSLSTCLRW